MPPNEIREQMDALASRMESFLKPYGFNRRDYIFNRWTKDGLCHVFDLQPGLKYLYGQFTANLGVFVPEVYTSRMDNKIPSLIRVGECVINARFCDFTDTDDEWWDTDSDIKTLVDELTDLLQTYGLPLFIKFPDRRSLVNGLLEFDEKYHVCMNPKLDIALMLEHLGEHEEAQKMFNQHYHGSTRFPEHLKYLDKVAKKQNWAIKSM